MAFKLSFVLEVSITVRKGARDEFGCVHGSDVVVGVGEALCSRVVSQVRSTESRLRVHWQNLEGNALTRFRNTRTSSTC